MLNVNKKGKNPKTRQDWHCNMGGAVGVGCIKHFSWFPDYGWLNKKRIGCVVLVTEQWRNWIGVGWSIILNENYIPGFSLIFRQFTGIIYI